MKNVNGVEVFNTMAEILDPVHTALLVIDVQNDGVRPEGWFGQNGKDTSAAIEMLPRLVALVAAARGAGVLPIFIQQTTLSANKSDPPAWLYFKTRDGRTRTDYSIEGTWGHQVVDELDVQDSEIRVTKFRPSAFHGTPLDDLLKTNGIRSVVTCGVVSQGCVQATTMDASFHDYYTVIAEDCIAGYNPELHDNAITFMKSRYDAVTGERLAALWAGIKDGSNA
ncbi:cysteine hydrolase family protein [Jatrophihabitans sp. DSM 45814]